MGNNDDSKKFQEELNRMQKRLDNVEIKQDEFGKSQDQMEENIIEIKSKMSQFMGGANPTFNPSAIQSPKIPEGGTFPSHDFLLMHENP